MLSHFSVENQNQNLIVLAQAWLNGQWIEGDSTQEPFESKSPCERFTLLQGKTSSKSQVDQAVNAARSSLRSWRRLSVDTRIEVIKKFQSIVKENADGLALLIARETGKALWEAKTEAAAVAGKVDLSIAALRERRDTVMEPNDAGQTVTRFKPHGVLAVLGPFNFPAHLPNGHIVPALLAGNTIVFKPSELTPAVGQWMIAAWEAAGLPAGVINLVQGGRETGSTLIEHNGVDGLLFTGSSNAGSYFHKQFAPSPEKILALEMGGNNPLVIGRVEDVEAAVYQTILSAFLTAGQRCTCARRLIVVNDRNTDSLLQSLIDRSQGISAGFYDDPAEPFMGTLISKSAGNQLLEGWRSLVKQGGQPLLTPESQRNCEALLSPGILEMPQPRTYEDREWFGPMLQVFRVNSFSEAIQLANDTRYGLSAGLLSDDSGQWDEFIAEIRAGVVNWNRQTTGASGKLPFGGCGLSGNHRPSGFYAADYCSFPVASMESSQLKLPDKKMTGLAWD